MSKRTGQAVRYKRIAIKCEQYQNEWLTGMITEPMDVRLAWKENFEVTISIERKGQYLNFNLPSKLDILAERVERLEKTLVSFTLTDDKKNEINTGIPNIEPGIEDLPF